MLSRRDLEIAKSITLSKLEVAREEMAATEGEEFERWANIETCLIDDLAYIERQIDLLIALTFNV